jgi:REP element-mobilizing transposase RayT/lambda repressor-like predicted transcriptional regulator
MPRKSRIDAPGALHHIIARGIERRKIFRDDADRKNLLTRIGRIVKDTNTHCLAWALIPNHFHLLLKTGLVPIATVMRRLLTGYAVSFNRRHRRNGHLFQNRYKSILCQEDTYLLELVRYIHLNPIRANQVSDMKALNRSELSGHSAILGRCKNDWQDVDGVLRFFGKNVSQARRGYRSFVQKGVEQGKRSEFSGGGLVRSSGGWAHVKIMRKAKIWQKSDERILGDGDFVERVLSSAQEKLERKYELAARGITLDEVAKRVAKLLDIKPKELWASGKQHHRVQARSLLCYWASKELGISMAELSSRLKLSPAAISLCIKRGEAIIGKTGYILIKSQN